MNIYSTEIQAYISVDVETSGPNPATYSLLSIGACTLTTPRQSFYVELKPVNDNFIPEAMAINQLSLDRLAANGLHPREAMIQFRGWLAEQPPHHVQPIFIAFNAPYDWMFVNDYFHRFLGANPFGHKALDIKSFYMGLEGVPWAQTSMRHVSVQYANNRPLTHNALHDAVDQANIFNNMLEKSASLK